MPQNRHTVRATVTIKPHIAEQFRKDSLKILLYCGEYQSISPYSQANVSFPNQVEIKVNESEVKSNFKGLKNKPGSTKPADLTTFIKKYKGEPNQIQVTYALTTRRFCFVVYLVRHISPEKLTDRIKRHSVIRKQKVLDAMSKANADPDIAATSIRMSLKDPISTLRITVPIRSSYCTHNQCFDGAMFMQLQEQAPQWSCPICTKTIPFESLCVDEYFQEILDKTPVTTEKVDIEPSGQWKVIKDENDDDEETAGMSNKRGRASYDDDFDDLVELDQPESKKINGIMRESFHSQSSPFGGASLPALNTPPVPSREASAPQSANKRPQSAVIDLTLSDDDEDDQPPRPAKRQHAHRSSYNSNQSNQSTRNTSYGTPNSLPDSSRYQAQNRTQPHQPPQQDSSFRPSNTHNQLPRPTFNASSMSPPYHPSPPMQHQPTWSPRAPVSNYQRHSTTPSYPNATNNNNSTISNPGMYPPPASPITFRPPPPPAPHAPREQYDTFYAAPDPGFNRSNNSSWSPRPGQTQQGGLRLPPMNAASPPGQSTYQGGGSGWRNDYDYDYGNGNGSWSQSPIG
jgi:E3 SUMO-protein ligase PIAS1